MKWRNWGWKILNKWQMCAVKSKKGMKRNTLSKKHKLTDFAKQTETKWRSLTGGRASRPPGESITRRKRGQGHQSQARYHTGKSTYWDKVNSTDLEGAKASGRNITGRVEMWEISLFALCSLVAELKLSLCLQLVDNYATVPSIVYEKTNRTKSTTIDSSCLGSSGSDRKHKSSIYSVFLQLPIPKKRRVFNCRYPLLINRNL